MSDFVRPDSLNWTCILNQTSALPPPLFGPPVFPLLPLVPIAVGAVVGVAIWWRNPVLLLGELPDRADQIPAIAVEEQPQPRAFQIAPIPAIAVEEQPQPRGLQIQPIPAIAVEEQLPDEQPSLVGVIWDGSQVAAAIRDIRHYVESEIPCSLFDSDSDARRSSSSGHGRSEYVRYPSLDEFKTDACLVVPNSMARLQQMLCSFPEAQYQETVRRACLGFCDVHENLLIIHVDPEAFSGPCDLSEESTKNWIMKLKITAKVCCLMWDQLSEHNQQFYPNLKKDCFAEVAGKLIENVFNIASSFSDARWSASHIWYMLPIFDTLVAVIHDIQQISASRSEALHNKITDIYRKMVNNISGILEETANDMHISKESAMHPATLFVIQALQFVHHNGVRLQSVLAPGDCTDDVHNLWVLKLEEDIHNLWVLKLKEDAGRIFKNEKDRQYILILNNAWFAWQNTSHPRKFFSEKQVERFNLLKEKYIKSYLYEFWVPLLKYVVKDPSRRQCRSSWHNFTADFNSMCNRQREWTVLSEPKERLRADIINLGIGTDGIFSPMRRSAASSFCFWKKQKNVTVSAFKNEVNALYQR
uniref:Exocyst subunit Exo70 family protein n=1 Tax=Arundo donax TaxID=35708 RepID=A0A0A9B9R4_ARUDO